MVNEESINKDIEILEQMNELASQESPLVKEAKLSPAPVRDVESSLASFTKHTFNIISEEYEFQKEIEKEIMSRLNLPEKEGGFSSKELIALHTNNFVNLNDRVSKVLGPTFQLMTSEVNADIAARASLEKQQAQVNINLGTENIKKINETCGDSKEESQAILQGIFQLQNLLKGINIKSPVEEE